MRRISFLVVLLGVLVTPGVSSPRVGTPQGSRGTMDPNALMASAQSALKQRQYSSALTFLKPLLRSHPDYAPGWFDLAYADTGLHQNDEAVQAYQKAIQLQPTMFDARLNLGILLLEMKQPAGALAQFAEAAKLKPEDARPHFYSGVADEMTSQYAPARQELETAVRLQPGVARNFYELGRVAMAQKDYAGARGAFEKAVALDPGMSEAKLGLATSLARLNQSAPSITYLERYLTSAPHDFQARFKLANLEIAEREGRQALANLTLIQEADAKFPNLNEGLASAYALLKQYSKAEIYYRKALSEHPNRAVLYGALGATLLDEKKYKRAEGEFRTELRLQPESVSGKQGLASALYSEGRFADAIPLFESVLQTPHPSPQMYFALAACFDRLHALRPAIQAYQLFVKTSGGKPPDQVWRAQQRINLLEAELKR
jgi:protein O-GlcNAc transferase